MKIRIDLFFQNNKKSIYFLLSFIVALAITWLLREPVFNQSQIYVLFLLIFSIGLWLTEAVPPFAVGLFIIAFLALSQGYEKFNDDPQDIKIYINTFSSSVIWLMMSGFFLASAMTKTKLDADLIKMTMRVCGDRPKWILFGLMTTTMVFSMLISNTATTAMVIAALMPLLNKLGRQSPVTKAFILGIPIAASTGGMSTIIGSPPNAIAVGALTNVGKHIDFLTWVWYGLPLTLFLTYLAWWVLVRLFIKTDASLSKAEILQEEGDNSPGFRIRRAIVSVVLLVTLALWLTSPVHHLSAAAVAVVPLVFLTLSGILKNQDIRAIGWDTLILVAGGIALGTGLQQTGLMAHYAEMITKLKVPVFVFLLLFAYVTMLLSNVMSHTASSTLLIPLGMAILPQNSIEVCMVVALSSGTALFLPVSTPPNAIAYSTGFIEQKDFRIGGLLIGLLGPAISVLWVMLLT